MLGFCMFFSLGEVLQVHPGIKGGDLGRETIGDWAGGLVHGAHTPVAIRPGLEVGGYVLSDASLVEDSVHERGQERLAGGDLLHGLGIGGELLLLAVIFGLSELRVKEFGQTFWGIEPITFTRVLVYFLRNNEVQSTRILRKDGFCFLRKVVCESRIIACGKPEISLKSWDNVKAVNWDLTPITA